MSETDETCVSATALPRPPPSSRIRVHNAELYTQLMDAADWSHIIAQEQQRQEEREEQSQVQRYPPQMQPSQQDRYHRPLNASKRARVCRVPDTAAELREEEMFRRRLDSFMLLQQRILDSCADVSASVARAARRTAEAGWRSWESTQLRPVQMCIDAQLRDPASSRQRDTVRHELLQLFLNTTNRAAAMRPSHAYLLPEEVEQEARRLHSLGIRYPAPPRREMAVDAHRRESSEVRRAYAQLAEDYRALQRESMTGVLSRRVEQETPLPPPQKFSIVRTSSVSTNVNVNTDDSGYFGSGRVEGTPSGVLLGSLARTTERAAGEHPTTTPPPLITPTPPLTTPTRRERVSCVPRMRGEPLESTSTETSRADAEVVPFAVLPSLGRDKDGDMLLQRIKELHAPRPRDVDLPVQDWGRFNETMYGWGVTADGDLKPSCDRRIACAWKLQHSDVMFDHYSFPRGLEGPLHTGKRVV